MGAPDPTPSKKSDDGGEWKPQETNNSTPSSPKPGRSPLLRRSVGKGSHKTTVPQSFKLATEARSLVRPCGCGKDGVFGAHGHGHNHHKKAPATPEVPTRGMKTPKSPQVTRKAKDPTPSLDEMPKPKNKVSAPRKTPPKQSVLPLSVTTRPTTPKPPKPMEEEKANRFVSTVVWYPEMQPEFNSTTLNISPGEDANRFIDEILVKEYDSYLKKRLPNSNAEMRTLSGPLHMKKVEATTFGKMIEGTLTASNIEVNPVSIS